MLCSGSLSNASTEGFGIRLEFVRRTLRPAIACLVFSIITLSTSVLLSQPDAEVLSEDAGKEEKLAKAKEYFRKGVLLYEAEDYERALEHFQASLSTYPSVANTINTALTLDKLGRFDEALALYEKTLVDFEDDLEDDDRVALSG